MKNIYKLTWTLTGILFIISLVMLFSGNLSKSGPIVIAFFVMLSISIRSFEVTKQLTYTAWIFTAVAVSLFYPFLFVQWGDFRTNVLITPLLQIIMFGVGSQISLNDFRRIITMPKGVIIGVVAQFSIMPLVALAISSIFNFPIEVKAGIILIGCVPSGIASNVMSLIARANLPLAVTLAAITTLLSPFVTPWLMRTLAGQFIEVNFWSMMMDIMNMIILPIIAGFIFNLFTHKDVKLKQKVTELIAYFASILLIGLLYLKAHQTGFAVYFTYCIKALAWTFGLPIIGGLLWIHFLGERKELKDKILALLSQVGIAFIIVVITAAGRDSLLTVGLLLMLTSILHNFSGYFLGYSLAWIFRMSEKDRRTIAFEVGMQNAGLASGLANAMGKIATVGLAPAIFGPLMNITGSMLASWWRGKPPKDENNTVLKDVPEIEVSW